MFPSKSSDHKSKPEVVSKITIHIFLTIRRIFLVSFTRTIYIWASEILSLAANKNFLLFYCLSINEIYTAWSSQIGKMEIIKSQKLTNLKWLNLFNVEFIDKYGNNKLWQVASRKKEPKCVTSNFHKADAVVIVAFHKTLKKMVVTKEYRVPLAGYEFGFAAGLVDEGETIREAARRELREETGLEITRFIKISPPVYTSAGMTDESVAMVYVECDGEPSNNGNEGAEDIEVIFVSSTEASRLCADTKLKFDAKAWVVLSSFADYGDF